MKHVQVRPSEIVIDRACMEEVSLTEKSECRGEPNGSLHCTGFELKKRIGCERLEVKSKTKEEKQ